MATKKEINEILETLNNGQFHIECPSCDQEVKLEETGLFHLDNFTPEGHEVYKRMLQDQKERRASLKDRQLKIPIKSEIGAKSVNLGFILERLAPTLDDFTFNKNDCRSMFDPIDYIIFEGLSNKNSVDKILFVDIKTGNARLTTKQRKIKEVIKEKKIKFKTYKP